MKQGLEKDKTKMIISLYRTGAMTQKEIAEKTGVSFARTRYYISRFQHRKLDENGEPINRVCKKKRAKPRQYFKIEPDFIYAKNTNPVGGICITELTETDFGFSAGDEVIVKRTGHDNDDDDNPKTIRGTITKIYPYFIEIQTKNGYKTSVLKTEIFTNQKTINFSNKKREKREASFTAVKLS